MQPQKPQTKPVRALLLEAAEYIRVHGHTKGALRDEGRVCVVGAINMVHGGQEFSFGSQEVCRNNHDARKALSKFLGLGFYGLTLVDWNNAPERTADEVIAALEGAAQSPGHD